MDSGVAAVAVSGLLATARTHRSIFGLTLCLIPGRELAIFTAK